MMLATVESISIGESFALSGVSIGIIMGVLACIMLLIYLVSWLFRRFDEWNSKRKGKIPPVTVDATAAEPVAKAPGSCGDLVLIDTTEREAAMIMAIVADSTETPLNELRFISIKQIKE